VVIPAFLFGLTIGLLLLVWQRQRQDARLKQILGKLASRTQSPFPLASQVSIAVAQQRREQQDMLQELTLLRQILQAAPVGYLQVDDENRLLWCNPQARQILGIPDAESKPRLLLELVRSYELDALIEQTRDAEQPCQSSWTFYPMSADPTHLSQQSVLTLQGYGLPLPNHEVGIFLENRQEIVALMQQRDRWTSDLAHELKTPLTSIRLVAETLQTRLDPSLRSWVDRLINETLRLSTLVQDLLDLSQIQRGTLRNVQLRPIELVGLIQAVWHSLEPLARRKNLQLDYCGPSHLIMQADEPRLHRLLINLLDNSIKYSPAEQTIRVKVSLELAADLPSSNLSSDLSSNLSSEADWLCLEIIDQGPGFPEKALPYVFERFYRADPSRARLALEALNHRSSPEPNSPVPDPPTINSSISDGHIQGGSGLGLSIVRQIVEAHHGTISASNHPETGGAWLQVRLPWQLATEPPLESRRLDPPLSPPQP
jgi:two-component system phosphate regulon sensor histidine kinase PhoR